MKRQLHHDGLSLRHFRKPMLERLERRLALAAEVEPNDSFSTATSFIANDALEGRLAKLNDVDDFKIVLNQGTKLKISDVNYISTGTGLALPPAIEILDKNGVSLVSSRDGRNLEYAAIGQGTYYVRITSDSAFGDIADGYNFSTSVVDFTGVSEQEPNDARATANTLTANQAFQGQLSPSDTADYFSFSLGSTDTLVVNFLGQPVERPAVRLRDSAGTIIDSGIDGQGLTFQSSSAGTYSLEILDNASSGQTLTYVGAIQIVGSSQRLLDAGNGFDSAAAIAISRADTIVVGELSTLSDIDTFAISVNSLSRMEISLTLAGSEAIPWYGRLLTAFDRLGNWVDDSTDGYISLERYLGSTPGEFFLRISAQVSAGLGLYGLRLRNLDDFSNQRDVPIHFIDFTAQNSQYWNKTFTASFGVPEAIPFITGMNQSYFGAYDVDVTLNKPDIPVDRYIQSGFGDFEGLGGGLGGGSYGRRRPSGSTANNADDTSWTSLSVGALNHEFGHAAGLGHARAIDSMMAYVSSEGISPPGSRYGFVNGDQRWPDSYLTNDRNRLDWNLASGSQVQEKPSDLNTPQELDSNLLEMSLEMNDVPTSYSTDNNPSHIAVGDFNADGWKDIVVTNAGTTLGVYLSDTKGGFLSPKNYAIDPVTWWNESVSVGDFELRMADCQST